MTATEQPDTAAGRTLAGEPAIIEPAATEPPATDPARPRSSPMRPQVASEVDTHRLRRTLRILLAARRRDDTGGGPIPSN